VVVEVLRTNVLQEALAWLARVPTVLMSRTVAESIPEGSVSEDPITVHVEIAATDRFAQSVRDREISLPRHPALLEQITAAKVRAVPSGNKVDSRHSGDTDLLRCVMWVNHRLSRKGKRSFNIVVSPR
jgi:hypothetical protein